MPSERLLRGMQKACSHDLPNQIVVLQSLLQMLQLEEADRLSPDGQEYVRRLQKVTQRTAELARFIKEMCKLNGYVGKPEELSQQVLAREIQGALKQHFPDKQFRFDWQWAVPSIVGDYRTVLQALIEILSWSAARQGNVCQVTGAAAEKENQLVVHFGLATVDPTPDNTPQTVSKPDVQPSPEQRMEIILAREWLAVSNATLAMPSKNVGDGPGECEFTIHVPNR